MCVVVRGRSNTVAKMVDIMHFSTPANHFEKKGDITHSERKSTGVCVCVRACV